MAATTPKQSLNPAFLKQSTSRAEIDIFKKEFIALLDKINPKETEEFHKNLIKDFLNAVYYKDKHYINTKGKTDLVIHNDNNTASSVGVLIEAKSPVNKAEMVRQENLNVKSFQELVLYYLRERKTGKNFELRYLIITNVYEWFVFDAQDFEKLFYQNKTLLKRFEEFQAGKLSGTSTDFFYKEIASPAIVETLHATSLQYTHFDIRDYEKILRNTDKEDERKLISLYKFLSPVHLLKQSFADDNNKLNNAFYAELLHIIGLEEVTQEGRKLIVRKKEKERDSGSIIENAIERIDAKNKWENVLVEAKNVSPLQEQQFEVALDLAITWINRILFLKLLESQILTYHNGNRDYAFLSLNGKDGARPVPTYNDIDTLFFSVLARKEEERTENIKRKFAHVPYLNSSLFEMTDTENKTICIDSLQDNVEMGLYAKSVLHGRGGKFSAPTTMPPLEYLLRFLDAYDFSSEGSEDIQEENKPLISASVLGLIFEKINGYKDGSFFTPSFITMYMCRETIGQAVIQKFKSYLTVETRLIASLQNIQTINDLHNLIPQIGIERANEIFNQIRICDPAVGSGHFLVSALNEMIYLKSELGILTDKNGKTLWNYKVTVDNDELTVRDPDGGIFVYNPQNSESQRVQETLFHEKQTLIEKCLFGVDINPNSVKICQLRLWIELLKHAYYTVGAGLKPAPTTHQLQTLPNIDINIKCGNSLMSRFAMNDKYLDNAGLNLQIRQRTKRYKEWVFMYKQCDNKEAKRQFKKNIEDEKAFFYQLNNAKDADFDNMRKAKRELDTLREGFDFFETEKNGFNEKIAELSEKFTKLETLYYEKIRGCFEWRFEFPEVLDDDGNFAGFDVVIGNPPYGVSIKDKSQRDYLISNIGKVPDYEIYYWFIDKSNLLLKEKGICSLIIPNTILFNLYAQNYRMSLFNKWLIEDIVDCSNFIIFKEATVRNVIFRFTKQDNTNTLTYYPTKDIDNFNSLIIQQRETVTKSIVENNNQNWGLLFKLSNQELNIISKIRNNCIPLQSVFPETSQGLIAYDKYRGQSTEIIKSRAYHSLKKTKETQKEWLYGEDVTRYSIKWNGKEYIEYCDGIANPRNPKFFTGKRILIREITNPSIFASITEKELYNDPSILIIKDNPDGDFALECLLAILNSKLATYYHFNSSPKATKGAFPKILVNDINNFPIPNISKEQQQPIIDLVNQILAAKKENLQADISVFENAINEMVYALYGVTEEEIFIIEKNN